MKKNIRLTELNKKEMRNLRVGEVNCTCYCACAGPSCDIDNGVANRDSGKNSGGGTIFLPEVIIRSDK